MVALTATVDTSFYGVRLEATGTVGTVRFYRSRAGEDTYLGSATGEPAVWVDYEPELNVSWDYVAIDDADTDVVAGITVPSDVPVLSSTTSSLALEVVVVAFRPYTSEARSVAHAVLGRVDPLVTIHPMLYPSGLLQFYAADNTARQQLLDMLYTGEPLHLRTTCAERLDTIYFLAVTWSDPFTNDQRREGQAYVEVEFQAIGKPTGIIPPDASRTYQTAMVDVFATYQDVLVTWGTYRQLLDG